jgi:hypothetical protein
MSAAEPTLVAINSNVLEPTNNGPGGYSSSEHAGVIAAISARFIVAPFNVRAASHAARLVRKGQALRPKGHAGGRAWLRTDSLIVATAIAYGAKVFYSGDKGCRELAKGEGIDARDLPNQPSSLFEKTEEGS